MHIAASTPVVYSPQLAFAERANSGRAQNANDAQRPAEPRQKSNNSQELSDEQRAQVAKLKSRDREVRAHEAAHLV